MSGIRYVYVLYVLDHVFDQERKLNEARACRRIERMIRNRKGNLFSATFLGAIADESQTSRLRSMSLIRKENMEQSQTGLSTIHLVDLIEENGNFIAIADIRLCSEESESDGEIPDIASCLRLLGKRQKSLSDQIDESQTGLSTGARE